MDLQNGLPLPVVEEYRDLNELLGWLKETHYSGLVEFFKRKVCFGDEEFLAFQTITKVFRFFIRYPCHGRDHATGVLWSAAGHVFLDFRKQLARFGAKEINIEDIDQNLLKTDETPCDIAISRDLVRLLREESRQTPDAHGNMALIDLMAGTDWDIICRRLGKSEPTARKRLAKSLAYLVVQIADRGIEGTLLDEFKRQNQLPKGEWFLRLWALGKKTKEIARTLDQTPTEALQLKKKCEEFFASHVRKKPLTKSHLFS